MFEYTTLQESYTGALIAGKGKTLNNINQITSKTIFKYQDMVRVRFGAGTPWRQCWCVVYPPDEKEVQKLEKELKKKKSVYDRSRPPILKGSVKFFDSKKIGKKTQPIATITDAYSAYAIYPQSKPLIDASTLVKLEGMITIHSDPPTSTEGFVFVMPEVHAAVSGFEIMLRWMFPVYDTFALYGRPTRLVADPLDPRSLMFGMPTDRRYGYLELLDVAGLISTEGSQNWNEATWRKNMKDLTQRRMTAITAEGGSRRNSRRMNTRDSDRASVRSTPAVSWGAPPTDVPGDIPRTDSEPAARPNAEFEAPRFHQHHRSASDSLHGRGPRGLNSAPPPSPPPHMDNSGIRTQYSPTKQQDTLYGAGEPVPELQHLAISPAPVAKPPGFSHAPGTAPPAHKLTQSPELRRAKSRMSNGTLSQLAGAGGLQAQQRVAEYQRGIEQARIADEQNQGGHPQDRGVNHATTNATGSHANSGLREGVVEHRRLSYESTSPDYRAPGEISTFVNTNISSYHHSENHSSPAHQTLNQAYQPSGLGGSLMNAAPNPVVAAVASSHDSRSSYESARASIDSNQNRRIIQRKPLHGSPSRNNDPRTPANPQRLEQIGRGISNMSGYSSYYDETPIQDFVPQQHASDRPSFERPRIGMLKTVGGSEQGQQQPKKSSDIPRIDFGQTINYAQNGLPASSSRQNRGPNVTANTQRQGSPQRKTTDAQYRPDHQGNQGSRQLAWHPGMLPASADAVAIRAMTPEEFVHQRAQAASRPQYAHQRQKPSTNSMRASPTPPSDQAKSDYFTHSRGNSSLDLLQQRPISRPQSRGAGATLGGGGSEDRLTARDQTQISRMTGAPLVSMATRSGQGGSQQAGLVGAIDQREMEKRVMKQGLNERQRIDAANANYRQDYGQQQMPPRVPQHGQQQQHQGYGQKYGQGGQQWQQQQPTQEEVQYQQRRLEMQREAFKNQQRPGGHEPGPGRGMGNAQEHGQSRG